MIHGLFQLRRSSLTKLLPRVLSLSIFVLLLHGKQQQQHHQGDAVGEKGPVDIVARLGRFDSSFLSLPVAFAADEEETLTAAATSATAATAEDEEKKEEQQCEVNEEGDSSCRSVVVDDENEDKETSEDLRSNDDAENVILRGWFDLLSKFQEPPEEGTTATKGEEQFPIPPPLKSFAEWCNRKIDEVKGKVKEKSVLSDDSEVDVGDGIDWDSDDHEERFLDAFESSATKDSAPPSSTSDSVAEAMITNLMKRQKTEDGGKESIWEVVESFRKAFDIIMRQLQEEFFGTTDDDGEEEQVNKKYDSKVYDKTKKILERLSMIQAWYYLQHEERMKNAVWKRQQHWPYPTIPSKDIIQLQDSLYLSHLAYVSDCSVIDDTITNTFRPGMWTLRNCSSSSKPNKPAHYMLVRNVSSTTSSTDETTKTKSTETNETNEFLLFLDRVFKGEGGDKHADDDRHLDVILVVRGTKEMGDVLSDFMIQPSPYYDDDDGNNETGKAFDGVQKAAIWLIEKYRDDLYSMLCEGEEKTGGWGSYLFGKKKDRKYEKIRLWVFGHSLGGGTAALMTIKMQSPKYTEWVETKSIGFGTPCVVSPNLSQRYRDVVTTVINDADVVPRASIGSAVNMLYRVVRYNFTQCALEDYDRIVNKIIADSPTDWQFQRDAISAITTMGSKTREMLSSKLSELVLPWDYDDDDDDDNNKRDKNRGQEDCCQNVGTMHDTLRDVELIPPGTCIHLYRDGRSWDATYMNCSFFGDIEAVQHMIDDHYIPGGYYNGMLNYVREQLKNVSWHFDYDLLEIPV